MAELDIDPILVTRKPTDLPEPITQAVRGGLQILGEEAEHVLVGLPKEIMEQSELLRTTGEYNPAPMVELLGLAAGGGIGAAEKDAIGVFGGRAWARDTNFLGDPKARKFVPPGSLPALERKYRSAFDSAQLMEMAGKSREEIFDQTGWFRGWDGKWRFEISDKDARLIEPPKPPTQVDKFGMRFVWQNAAAARQDQRKLSDVLHHPKLFEQYPDLADLRVRWTAEPKSAYYAPYWEKGYGQAGEAKEYIALNPDDPDLLTRILHEVQHAVQAREQFSPGGSPRELRLLTEAEKAHREYPGSLMPEDLAFESYKRHAGEVEARNVQHRRFLHELDQARRESGRVVSAKLDEFIAKRGRPWETEDRPSGKLIFREPHDRPPRIRLTPVKGDPFAHDPRMASVSQSANEDLGVIDGRGERPRMVTAYHGTDRSFNEPSTQFGSTRGEVPQDKGTMYFSSTSDLASMYGRNIFERQIDLSNARVFDVDKLVQDPKFLSEMRRELQNIATRNDYLAKRAQTPEGQERIETIWKDILDKVTRRTDNDFKHVRYNNTITSAIIRRAREEGLDVAVVRNMAEDYGMPSDQYIIFNNYAVTPKP